MSASAGTGRSQSKLRTVAVIGGGITGLAAANRLRDLAAELGRPLAIALFESSKRAGGKIVTVLREGFVAECGPDCFVSEKPGATGLIDRLDLSRELIAIKEQNRKSYILHSNRLHEIPDGLMMGAPTRLLPVLTSRLFSTRAKVRIALEPLLARRGNDADESLARFIARHFGREMVDRMVGPLIGGIFGGDPDQLSAHATMPQMVASEHRWRSLTLAMKATRPRRSATDAKPSSMLTLRGGMQTLSDALVRRLGEVVNLGTEVTSLRRESGRWRLSLAGAGEFLAEAVICASPAWVTARLCREIDAELADTLDSIHYNSVATVNFGFATMPACRLPAGTGFVIARDERRMLKAVSFSSAKFENRVPKGGLLVRAFISDSAAGDYDESDLISHARLELADILGLAAEPTLVEISRQARALPRYNVGHQERVVFAEERAARLRGLFLAGAAFRGVGVPDCISSGEAAASEAFACVTTK